MEVEPVKRIEKPKYPLKTDIDEVELKKQIPKRWSSSPAAKIALGTLAVVTLSGCYSPGGTESIPSMVTEGSIETTHTSVINTPVPTMIKVQIAGGEVPFDLEDIVDGAPMGKYAICRLNVAPLFLHGEGIGTFGDDAASRPDFLSEEEALEVINGAAKGYGLEFTNDDAPEFGNVQQPVTNIYSPGDKNRIETFGPLQTDFVDKEHRIAIEFVSVEDVGKWHQDTGFVCSVKTYDTRDAAGQLSDSLDDVFPLEQVINIGVFYDPLEPSKNEAEAKIQSKEQLAAQAKDFFEWLKTQGVI